MRLFQVLQVDIHKKLSSFLNFFFIYTEMIQFRILNLILQFQRNVYKNIFFHFNFLTVNNAKKKHFKQFNFANFLCSEYFVLGTRGGITFPSSLPEICSLYHWFRNNHILLVQDDLYNLFKYTLILIN